MIKKLKQTNTAKKLSLETALNQRCAKDLNNEKTIVEQHLKTIADK